MGSFRTEEMKPHYHNRVSIFLPHIICCKKAVTQHLAPDSLIIQFPSLGALSPDRLNVTCALVTCPLPFQKEILPGQL